MLLPAGREARHGRVPGGLIAGGLLGDDRPRTLAVATGLGAASSSCSYAAVALARGLLRRGAGFTAAMVFEIASTNLVIELGIILALLLSALVVRFFQSGGAPMLRMMGGQPAGDSGHH